MFAGSNPSAVYEYSVMQGMTQQTCDGEWGEIPFDFERVTAKIIRLADWDTTVTNIFAKRAIRFLLDCGAEKLPKEALIALERRE